MIRNNIYTFSDTRKQFPSDLWLDIFLSSTAQPNLPIRILVIGCQDGFSSTFFSDYLMDNEDSSLICVDPFNPDIFWRKPSKPNINVDMIYEKMQSDFYNNITKSTNFDKISFYKMSSKNFFDSNISYFDIIFLDGSLYPSEAFEDFCNAFQLIKYGGFIWIAHVVSPITYDTMIANQIEQFLSSQCDCQYRLTSDKTELLVHIFPPKP